MTSFRVLGPVEAWTDERQLTLAGPQQVKLLAFLLLNANRAVSADELVDAIWGAGRDGAAKRLQMGVFRLRRALEPLDGQEGPRLRTVSGGYLLSVGPDELDSDVFIERVREGRGALHDDDPARASELLADALALWRGPSLAEVAFEDFAQGEIRRLGELRLEALEARIDADLQLGRHAELISELEGLLAEHPARERLAGQLMMALYRCGRQAEALEVYQRIRTHLAEQLGLEPGPALKAIQADVLQQVGSLDVGAASIRRPTQPSEEEVHARGREGDVARHLEGLPILATPTFGRRQQIEDVSRLLLSPDVRLVSLVGPGGVGKTRLGVAVAHECESQFPDGSWWVELAGVERADGVPSAVARALAVVPRKGESARDALILFLARSRALLVIDNFEHLLEAAGLLSDLLAACPGLTVLVTSREALSLTGEHCVIVEPLPVPDPPSKATVSDVEATDATALFLAAVRRRDLRFLVTPASAPVIASVCARLDGLPLALELAAAPTGLLGINELAARLDSAFASLGVGPRDAPDRHRTLHATIEWSYHLLESQLQRAFARFAVFAGGATVEAASAVTDATVQTLQALVGKSLIDARKDADGSSRLVMLETVRQYGLQRLAQDPDEEEAVRRRHGEYYLHLVEQGATQPGPDRRDEALFFLDNEIENIRVALSWSRDAAPTLLPRLVETLKEAWWIVGSQGDAKQLVESALRELDPLTQPHRYAELLNELSWILWTLGSSRESLATAQRAVAMLPGDHPGWERTRLLSWLARIQFLRGRYVDAARDAHEAMTAAVSAGDRRSQGTALNTLGIAEIALGRVNDGAGRLRHAIRLSREEGDVKRMGGAYANLSEALSLVGRTREGLAVAMEGLAAMPEHSTVQDRGWLMLQVSDLCFEAGDWDAARFNLEGSRLAEVGVWLVHRRLCEAQLSLGIGDVSVAADCLREIDPLIESSLEPQWVGRHGALLAELLARQGQLVDARTVVARTLGWLEHRTEDVMRVSRVAAVGAIVEADIAQCAREQGDVITERDAVSRCRLHLHTLRDSDRRGGPIERAWRTVGTAELTRACARSDPSPWLNAAQQWDAIGRPYPSAVARWRAAGALVDHGERAKASEVTLGALRTASELGSRWLIEEIISVADRSGLELVENHVREVVG